MTHSYHCQNIHSPYAPLEPYKLKHFHQVEINITHKQMSEIPFYIRVLKITQTDTKLLLYIFYQTVKIVEIFVFLPHLQAFL